MTEPTLLFAHGAGSRPDHPWMRVWAERLGAFGAVRTFPYDYIEAGRRRPDPLPRLIDRHRAELAVVRASGGPIVLVGKSMGGRVGCHVSALEPDVRAVICFGYPLLSSTGVVRDAALQAVPAPLLLVQGTRDPLAPVDRLLDVVAGCPRPPRVHLVDGADHDLRVGSRALATSGRTAEDVVGDVLRAVLAFLREADVDVAGAATTSPT